MLAIWSLLAETRDLARLIESSRGVGCNKANIPLEHVTEFSPIASRAAGEVLIRLLHGLLPKYAAFTAIIHYRAAHRCQGESLVLSLCKCLSRVRWVLTVRCLPAGLISTAPEASFTCQWLPDALGQQNNRNRHDPEQRQPPPRRGAEAR